MRRILFAAVAMFAVAALVSAQGLSTINGSVTDPSGAVIPGAKITATEVDTTLSRETVSSPDGLYTINGLRPTRYNLTASAAGFRRVLQTGLVLEANDSVTINLKLEVGTASETVNVEANAVQVDTTSSTIRQVVDSARMIELPL